MIIRQAIWLALVLILSGCAQGSTEITPPEIHYGEDICAECDMIISDIRFAAGYAHEIEPGRYESIAFDDIGDMLVHADKHPEHKVIAWYVHDFYSSETLDATIAHYMFSNRLQTPMGQGTAAHATLDTADHMAAEMDGEVLDWDGLLAKHRAGTLMVSAMPGKMEEEEHEHDAGNMHEHEMHQRDQMIVLGDIDEDGYAIELVAVNPLHAGYNEIMVHINDAEGEPVSDPEITLMPMMTMFDGKKHAAAVEQPVSEMAGMAHGALVFPMPSGPDLGTWTLGVTVTDPANDASFDANFDIKVAPSKLISSFMTPDERKIFLAVVTPVTPSEGAQPFEVYAFEKMSMLEWPALDNLTLTVEPEMPTMGHGSPNNENPVSEGDGHYTGVVNFSMAGPWTVTVTAADAEETLGEVVFEYEVIIE
jgi:hypothetical protein